MEIICAGYPKTGSKSCSSALRALGYNVADFVETGSYLSYQWVDFVNGKIEIEKVIDEYKKHGFHANQDIPSNFLWEDLYNASPNAKVILTVRDSEEKWKNSWIKFMKEMFSSMGNPAFWIFATLGDYQLMGPKWTNMETLSDDVGMAKVMPGIDKKKRAYTWQGYWEYYSQHFDGIEENYRKHNENVKAKVPADRLLVWKVKDGWEPLCKFLGQPIPDGPIPHDNKTGDPNALDKIFFESPYWEETKSIMKWNLTKIVLQVTFVGSSIFLYKTGGWPLKTIGTTIASAFEDRFGISLFAPVPHIEDVMFVN